MVAIKLVQRLFAYPSWLYYVHTAALLVTYGSTWSGALQWLLACHRHQSVQIATINATIAEHNAVQALIAIALAVVEANTQPPPRRRLRRADLAEMPRRVLFA